MAQESGNKKGPTYTKSKNESIDNIAAYFGVHANDINMVGNHASGNENVDNKFEELIKFLTMKKSECNDILGVEWSQVSIMVTRLKTSNKSEYDVIMTQFDALKYDSNSFLEILKGVLESNGFLNGSIVGDTGYKRNEGFGEGRGLGEQEGVSAPPAYDNNNNDEDELPAYNTFQ